MLVFTAAGACLSSPAPPRGSTAGTAPRLPRLVRLPLITPHSRAKLLRPLRAARPTPPPAPAPSSRPARDRVIEFGRYKGQMLGTLPPSYLRWVVEELDYGDTAAWAGLARDVLGDPVYVDRVEWEHAHRFLRGDADDYDYAAYDDGDGPLQEMAERFGWDLSDEEGWGRLDLRLIGTSYGGRIPRKGGAPKQSTGRSRSRSNSSAGGAKKGFLFDVGAGPDGGMGKRDERRERVRTKREEQARTAKMDMLGVKVNAGVQDTGVPGSSTRKARIGTAKKEILGLGRDSRAGEMLEEKRTAGKGGQGGSPFPGRQAFLDKVRKLKGDDS